MTDRIFGKLDPVRRRQRAAHAARWAAFGLMAGSFASLAMALWRLWARADATPVGPLALLAAGPVLGAIAGLLRGRGWSGAAAAVDMRYGLKDRTLTAIDFARIGSPTPVHQLQVADAEEHLEDVDPRQVAPIRLPSSFPFALAVAASALLVLFWPRPGVVRAEPAAPLEAIVAAAEEARSSLEELAEEAKKNDNKELHDLVQQMTKKIEEMKQPGVDLKEALAKLSEMQSSIASQQALFNVGAVDAQMTSLGEAMASTQALESAGQALQQQKYEKAADALEQAEPKFDRKEAKNLKEKLKKAAAAQGEAGLGELSEATAQMADSLEDPAAFAESARKVGKLARAQGRRKHITNLLTLLNNNLSECKGNCKKNCDAQIRMKKKSTKSSDTWGRSISGNTDGDKTKLGAERKREQVQGKADEGPSEVETTHSPEGRQLATRSYRENYAKYRRKTEAALNSEPIPLGQRETIRKYFELIRPQGEEIEKSDPKPAAQPQPTAAEPAAAK